MEESIYSNPPRYFIHIIIFINNISIITLIVYNTEEGLYYLLPHRSK